jgi:hypothetical protein
MPDAVDGRLQPIRAAGLRRLIWRLVRPFALQLVREELGVLVARNLELQSQLADAIGTTRTELLATNHRITWIDEHGTSASQIGSSE